MIKWLVFKLKVWTEAFDVETGGIPFPPVQFKMPQGCCGFLEVYDTLEDALNAGYAPEDCRAIRVGAE